MKPAAVMGAMTATTDPITAPCVPNVLIGGRPAACLGDTVTGLTITGTVTLGSTTVLIGGRPAARMGDMVNGVNTTTGVPIPAPVPIVLGCVPTVLIGG